MVGTSMRPYCGLNSPVRCLVSGYSATTFPLGHFRVGIEGRCRRVKILDRLWGAISDGLFGDSGPSAASEEGARQRAQATAPGVWLLGKTGAGKTAIVSTLTGDPRATVGAGFEPCTRTASFYDVPQEVPIIR